MKPSAYVLAGSLALNAIIACALIAHPSVKSLQAPAGAPSETATSERLEGTPSAPAPASPPAPELPLDLLDADALVVELRRQNYPLPVIDALVTAKLRARLQERRREIMTEIAQRPWWQVAGGQGPSLMTPAQRTELRELAAVARNETLRLLGLDALDPDGAIRARYSYIAPERAIRLDALLRDYEDIRQMMRDEMRGLRTQADRDSETLLDREKENDIAALLTAGERDLFQLRTSVAADTMRLALFVFRPDEAEYRTIHEIVRQFHEAYPGRVDVDGRNRPMSFFAFPEHEAKIREQLGESRFADWQLATEFQTSALIRMAPKFGLDATTVRQAALQVRAIARESQAILRDTQAPTSQKRNDMAALAQVARETLTATLGEPAATQLLSQLKLDTDLERGLAVSFDGHGMLKAAVPEALLAAPKSGFSPSR